MDYDTYSAVKWVVEIGDEFQSEYENLPADVQDELLAMTRLLQQFGPQLKRPHVDTLNGSRHANMKELRFTAAEGYGESRSPSIPSAKLYCLSPEINRAAVRKGFTAI